MLNSDLSPATPQGGRNPLQKKPCGIHALDIESVVANSFVPSDSLVDGQVIGLGTVHPHLTLDFLRTWILPLHLEEEVVVICNGWTPKKEDEDRLLAFAFRARVFSSSLSLIPLHAEIYMPFYLNLSFSMSLKQCLMLSGFSYVYF